MVGLQEQGFFKQILLHFKDGFFARPRHLSDRDGAV